MSRSRPWFPSLDGLRCLAILPVVWHHATPGPLGGILGRGPLGVDLFFVISGFLITTLLLAERSDGPIDLRGFWVRRSLRIFPLYYVVLGAFVLHALFVRAPGPTRDHFLASVPYYATYTSNWFVYVAVDHPIAFAFAWSLATEEQFYLFWPPLLRVGRSFLLPGFVMALLVMLDQAAERGLAGAVLGDGLAYRITRSFATPIGLGALLSILSEAPTTRSTVRAVLGHRLSAPVALGLVVSAAWFAWPVLQTHLAMTALVGASVLRPTHLLAPLFESRPLRFVGTVSYGVYLVNVPVVTAIRAIATRTFGPGFVWLSPEAQGCVVFALAFPVSLVIATLTERFVERPFLTLRERWSSTDRAKFHGAAQWTAKR